VLNPVFAAPDETSERRFNTIVTELRCLVCQNESLAASNAELAHDLRREIRDMIEVGKSDGEIMDFMVDRYGDFVRYRPPLKGTTLLLWFGPALLFAGGLGCGFVYLRRRSRASDRPVSEAERNEAERLRRGDFNPRPPQPSSLRGGTVDRSEANLSILRDELHELEKRRDEGSLDENGFTQTRDELHRRLLEEAGHEASAISCSRVSFVSAKRTAIALGVVIPLAAAGGYALLGNPSALNPAQVRAHAGAQEVDTLLRRLAERLEADPNDMPGWILLARSYKTLGRFAEAAEAFGRAETVIDGDAALLADYAEVLALAHGGRFAGKPEMLIARALAAAPDEPQVLFVAGAAANARQDYAAVVEYWGRLLPRLDPGSDEARALDAVVEQARYRR
jgi:cytochrome c-type biogenesis protein CcmH